ncbi:MULTISPECIES: sensor histidine kinase [unclassified Methylobacterium]|jgi:two-component system CheB/CheR fusion protein|uniref:sensor histidine kinase n=1 Tax=unclassified Methylobacterium TaxID=2615210 RepID=UPI00135422EE|nr:PAS domain-containing protein [Methylobacterium sp. 2A]MWV24871.1 PAS domain-containing protein [Methylobacterium sp. 2A]
MQDGRIVIPAGGTGPAADPVRPIPTPADCGTTPIAARPAPTHPEAPRSARRARGAATLPVGCGELGDLVRTYDWARTPLGPIADWPQSLIFAASTVLLSPVPIVLLWGADGIMIYNDAYSGFAGGRHPQLLGSKVREGWPEVADFNDHVMRVGLAGGTLSYRDQELTLHRYGRPEQVWMNLDYSPVFDEDGKPAGVIAIVVESTERVLAERRLRESEALFRTLAQGIPQLIWRAGNDGACIWVSPQWIAYTGQGDDRSLGWGWLDAVHPDDVATARTAWQEAAVSGQLSYEHRLCSAGKRSRWFQTRAAPVRDGEGRIVEWLGTSTDIDDLRQLQERQQVMVAELQHRTRNLLGVVRAIAKQTMALTGPGELFKQRFNDRLSALSRVQGLLSRSDQEPITLRTLIETELAALNAPAAQTRIRIAGPVVRLRKATVQTFALALHELATNALKYGAFTAPQGSLSVTWRICQSEEGRRLLMDWVEEGLVRPPEARDPPPRSGYGRDLIERALPYALKARTHYALSETALRCTIDIPLPEGETAGSLP